MVLLVLFQIYLGALVAGLHAGLSYNTWPLMDGAIIPGDLLVIEPVWRNFFESPKTVPVRPPHVCLRRAGDGAVARLRDGADGARDDTCPTRLGACRPGPGQAAHRRRHLLAQAHMHWALLHQGFALIVLIFATAHWRAAKGAYPLQTDDQGQDLKDRLGTQARRGQTGSDLSKDFPGAARSPSFRIGKVRGRRSSVLEAEHQVHVLDRRARRALAEIVVEAPPD